METLTYQRNEMPTTFTLLINDYLPNIHHICFLICIVLAEPLKNQLWIICVASFLKPLTGTLLKNRGLFLSGCSTVTPVNPTEYTNIS